MQFNPNITEDDFSSICRLCLKRKCRLKPIFKSEVDITNTAAASFNQMIAICFGIEVYIYTIILSSIFSINFMYHFAVIRSVQTMASHYSFVPIAVRN